MDTVFFFIIMAINLYILYSLIKWLEDRSERNNTTQRNQDNLTSYNRPKTDPNLYTPLRNKAKSRNNKLTFKTFDSVVSDGHDLDIKDLVDAFTGSALKQNEPLYQCLNCKVFYQLQSFEVIREENSGRCVACLKDRIVRVAKSKEQRGRNADVGVITLSNYKKYEGRVITFEGYVHNVLTSRRGIDYAVMFEKRSWAKGFKMVAFSDAVSNIGGESFFFGLSGRRIRVRGLLSKHPDYGYQIIISEKGMILSIK